MDTPTLITIGTSAAIASLITGLFNLWTSRKNRDLDKEKWLTDKKAEEERRKMDREAEEQRRKFDREAEEARRVYDQQLQERRDVREMESAERLKEAEQQAAALKQARELASEMALVEWKRRIERWEKDGGKGPGLAGNIPHPNLQVILEEFYSSIVRLGRD